MANKGKIMKSKYIGNPLTKDLVNRKLSGVCAGVAKHYNLNANLVRVGAIVFGCFVPVFAIGGYLLASWLMPDRRY